MGDSRKGDQVNYYERLRSKMIHRLGGQCFMCGRTHKLEFHHVEPKAPQKRNGGKGNLLHVREVLREGGRVWLLCFRCHTLVDPERKQFFPGDSKCINAEYVENTYHSNETKNPKTMIAIQR